MYGSREGGGIAEGFVGGDGRVGLVAEGDVFVGCCGVQQG